MQAKRHGDTKEQGILLGPRYYPGHDYDAFGFAMDQAKPSLPCNATAFDGFLLVKRWFVCQILFKVD